ncbi:MAG TPA: VWA domain-containing protein [Pyrinomonadaceae bacterium]|nr:VWA domain-containing protein [Pyrinomonadaceae bacterium]
MTPNHRNKSMASLAAVAVACVLMSAPSLPAQERQPARLPDAPARSGQVIDPDEIITVETSEILLPVTVRDSRGRLVTTLGREDFRVFEDGREQPLSDLRLRRVPADVLLMIDSSSSVANNFEDFRRAAEEFASRLAPEDRVSLLKFDDRVELLQDWTASRAQLRRALRRVTPGMFTRFNDALYLAAREQFKDPTRRRAAVVLSDGIDSGRGSSSAAQALRALLEASVGVYCISNTGIERARKTAELDALLDATPAAVKFNQLKIEDLRASLQALGESERALEALTSATGGRLYKPGSFADLDRVYAEVAEELRHQYALYYSPLDRRRDGRFRRVQVRTADPALRVTARAGYFAPRG